MNRKHITRPSLVAAVAFAKANDADDEGLTFTLPEDLTALSDEELAALVEQADEAIDALAEQDASDEVIAALEGLVEAKNLLTAEVGTRAEAAEAKAAKKAELLALARPVAEDVVDEATEVDAEAEAEVVAEAEAVVAEAAEELPVAAAAEPVVAAAAPRPRPQRIILPASGAQRAAAVAAASSPFSAAANVPGFHPGQALTKDQVVSGLNAAMRGVSKASILSAQRAGQRFSQRYPIAQINKPGMGVELGSDATESMIEAEYKRVTDQSKLPGGSLLAAGGWCAPSETVYDLCSLESRDGLISLPEMNVSRGGLRFTQGLDWSTVLANTGFCFDEDDDIAGDYDPSAESGDVDKPCDVIPCPTFTDVRLQVCGVCVTGGNLQHRAYPELTPYYVDQVLTGHFHRVAGNVINAMLAGSTAVTHSGLAADTGAASPILSAIELQATDIRYKYRMSDNTVLEAVFPIWVKGVIRADLALRAGVLALDITDAQIEAWFRLRKINPQFVYNWQNLGGSPATDWPTSVVFMIYPAGTFVKGTSDLITIEMLHDSTLNAQNNFTAIFTEEAWSVMKMCFEARRVTVNICPSGITNHATTAIVC